MKYNGESESLRQAIQRVAGTWNKDIVSIIIAQVDSVNESDFTCDVTPIGGDATTSIPSVLLSAESEDGVSYIPEIGSTVIVAMSTRNTAFIIMYSSLSKIRFLDGSFDGLVKIQDLVDRLNNLENAFNQHLILYNAHTHGGVTSGMSATGATTPDTQILTQTTKQMIENTKITHGT